MRRGLAMGRSQGGACRRGGHREREGGRGVPRRVRGAGGRGRGGKPHRKRPPFEEYPRGTRRSGGVLYLRDGCGAGDENRPLGRWWRGAAAGRAGLPVVSRFVRRWVFWFSCLGPEES